MEPLNTILESYRKIVEEGRSLGPRHRRQSPLFLFELKFKENILTLVDLKQLTEAKGGKKLFHMNFDFSIEGPRVQNVDG